MKFFSRNNGLGLHMYSVLLAMLLLPALARAHTSPIGEAYLQQQSVTGIVSDSSGPIPGVTVVVKGTAASAVSDDNGKFTIQAGPSDVLVFSYLGMKTIEAAVSGQTVINIVMAEDATQLEEVVVNAGYYSVKDSERTGSIARITAKDIGKQPVTNVLAAMQGRMAGVSVTQTSGAPGSSFDIQIRGQNSLRDTGNDPLYIVDGVPYSSELLGANSTTIVLPRAASPISTLNPADIENIEILKDADATAIYGSRGANGVVLITTKKGKAGKTRYSASISQGFGSVTRFMDLMGTAQYLEMRREAFANDGITEYPDNAYDVNGTWDPNRYTDWQEELTGKTASIRDMQASVSGGSDTTTFLIGGTYHDETTVFPGDFSFNRSSFRANVNHHSIDQRFKINLAAGYVIQNNTLPGTDLTRESRSLAPNAPALYDEDGNLNWADGSWENPLRILESRYLAKTNNLVANTLMSYSITDGLEARVSLGYTETSHNESRTLPSTMYNPASGVGPEASSLYMTAGERNSWIVEPQLDWSRTFSESSVELLAGATFQKQQSSQLMHEAIGFASNSLIHSLAAASYVFITNNSESEYNYQAFYGRANYKFRERYILNLTGRRDGSSRFGPGKQFAWFGAAGAAWLFSREDFLKDSKLLSFGKLRGSYGSSGNDQIGDYQFLDTYSVTGNNYQGVVGLQPTQLYNADFGWETNKKLEAAIEAGFLQDRIFLTVAWYRNRSSNQLVGIPLPGTTGFGSIQANLDATVQNTGIEATLRTVNFQGKDFGWTTSFNISSQKNKLLSFPGLESSTYANQFVVGEPLNIRLTYHYLGIDPETGVYKFEDVNGDGQLTSVDDRKTVKDLNPEYYGGIHNEFRYKRWNLDFLFQFVKQENVNASSAFGRPGALTNQPTAVGDRWQQPGDSALYQMVSSSSGSAAGQAFSLFQNSDAAVSDASYIRLKNVALSYDLPENVVEGVQCRFYVHAQNLLTFTKYKDADPEFRNIGYLPPLRVVTAGVQFNF